MCLEKHDFLRRALRLLETPEITEEMAAARAFQLVQANRLVCYDHYIYRTATATVENNIAFHIAQQMKTTVEPYENLDHAILGEERKLRITLAPEQREAVKMALSTKFCVITGGPGQAKPQFSGQSLICIRKSIRKRRSYAAPPPDRQRKG